MPFRNAAATLPECIASIEAQTMRGFEVIAIDDRSEDESAALCARAGFRVLRANGLVNALNAGLAAARGGGQLGSYRTWGVRHNRKEYWT